MKPYNSSESKQDQVGRMFDVIAPTYDRLNHLMSIGIDRLWRRAVVNMVAANKPTRLLDLATGTGDMAIALARRCPNVAVTGADLSGGMLEVGRQKIEKRGLSAQITLVQTQAEQLPFADGEFDAVTIAFGVRNFDDIPKSLGEIYRVLVPGGKLYILEFSRPQSSLFGALFRFYFHRIMPLAGGWISGDPKAYTYLPQSVDEFPQGVRFIEMLSQAGFEDCGSVELTGGVSSIYKAEKR